MDELPGSMRVEREEPTKQQRLHPLSQKLSAHLMDGDGKYVSKRREINTQVILATPLMQCYRSNMMLGSRVNAKGLSASKVGKTSHRQP